jgi:hypothetical protein
MKAIGVRDADAVFAEHYKMYEGEDVEKERFIEIL